MGFQEVVVVLLKEVRVPASFLLKEAVACLVVVLVEEESPATGWCLRVSV